MHIETVVKTNGPQIGWKLTALPLSGMIVDRDEETGFAKLSVQRQGMAMGFAAAYDTWETYDDLMNRWAEVTSDSCLVRMTPSQVAKAQGQFVAARPNG